MKWRKVIKRIIVFVGICILLLLGIILYANWVIPAHTKKYVFDNVNDVPALKVGLVLGTSQYVGQRENLYFSYRIQAAKELYDAHKVKFFVVSGDNKHISYNEPRDMQMALIKAGIPDSVIFLDYAGFRTLDSVVRMKEIFEEEAFVVVSQQFHNERAIYLAQHYDLTAYGYNAKDLELNKWSVKTKFREKLARVKVFIDIITRKQPKFLGETIKIE